VYISDAFSSARHRSSATTAPAGRGARDAPAAHTGSAGLPGAIWASWLIQSPAGDHSRKCRLDGEPACTALYFRG
jgi:hypothetical protein